VIAGLTRTNCLFRLHEKNTRKDAIDEFLKALKVHRSSLVRDYLDTLGGHIQFAFLPPYAPPQPGRVSVGMAQASCAGQLLSQRSERIAYDRTQQTQACSKTNLDHRRLLDAGYSSGAVMRYGIINVCSELRDLMAPHPADPMRLASPGLPLEGASAYRQSLRPLS
jgi:hypothetical protein